MCCPIYGFPIVAGEQKDEPNVQKCYGYGPNYDRNTSELVSGCENYIKVDIEWPHYGTGCGFLPYCSHHDPTGFPDFVKTYDEVR